LRIAFEDSGKIPFLSPARERDIKPLPRRNGGVEDDSEAKFHPAYGINKIDSD